MDCQSDPRCVLRVVSSGGEPANIRGIFTNAGEIFCRPQLFNGIPGHHYYFVEFQHRKSAERALRLRLGLSEGLRLYPLDGPFLEQFHSCKARGPSHQFSTIRDCHPTWSNLRRDRCDFPVQKRPSCIHPYGLNTPGPPQSDQDDRSHDSSWTPGGDPTSYSAHTSMYVGTSIGMRKNLSQTPSLPYSLETCLVFEIQGQKQVYDLSQDSGLNPESIIELLRLSKSERGNWMMAGAYFRRRGNPRAALQVVATMVQVMLNHGYNLDNLKPAFPLLAACELDLARLSRNVCDEKGYNDHLENAKSWLQMIYGVDSPALKLASQNAFSPHTTPQPSGTQFSHGMESRSLKRYDSMTKAGRLLSAGGNSGGSHHLAARKSLPEGRKYDQEYKKF